VPGSPNAEAEQIAGDFEEENEDVIVFAGRCTDGQWSAMVAGEDWPVGVVLHHIAIGHQQMLGWLDLARRGEEIAKTAAEIDADNARHAHDFAGVTRSETVEGLRRHGDALALFIRSLDAEELATSVAFGPAEGMEVTTQALAAVSARHCRTHLADAREAVESATT
jgi:hypothetical protein